MVSLLFYIVPGTLNSNDKYTYISPITFCDKGESSDVLFYLIECFEKNNKNLKVIAIKSEDTDTKELENRKDVYIIEVPSLDKLKKEFDENKNNSEEKNIFEFENWLYMKIINIVKELREFEDIEEIYFCNIRGLNFYINVVYDIVRRIYTREYIKSLFNEKKRPILYIITTLSTGNPYYIYRIKHEVFVSPFLQFDPRKIKEKEYRIKDEEVKKFILDLYVRYVLSVGYPVIYIKYVDEKGKIDKNKLKEIYQKFINEIDNLQNQKYPIQDDIFNIDLLFAYNVALQNIESIIDNILKNKRDKDYLMFSKEKDDGEEKFSTKDTYLKEYLDLLNKIEEFKPIVQHIENEIATFKRIYDSRMKKNENINQNTSSNIKKEDQKSQNKLPNIRNFVAHRGLLVGDVIVIYDIQDNKVYIRFNENNDVMKWVEENIKNKNLHIY